MSSRINDKGDTDRKKERKTETEQRHLEGMETSTREVNAVL